MGTPNEGINGTLATGLLGHWSFDGGSLLDESGNGRNFTLSGTVYNVEDKDGRPDNAKTYNRTGKLTTPYTGTPQDIGVSMWVKIPSGLQERSHVLTYEGYSMSIGYNGSVTIYFHFMDGTGGGTTSPTLGLTDDNWHHIFISHMLDDRTILVFIDSILRWQLNGPAPWLICSTNVIEIGGVSSYEFFQGDLDEVRIYDRILTGWNVALNQTATGEIAELFDMGVNYAIITPNSPIISVDDGTYIGSITVEMSADPGCEIYYTLNGSDPDETDLLYERPITISRSVVLKAVAIKNGVQSEIVTKIYYIEGGDIGMEENQSAGLIVIGWTPEGETKETILGEVPADGQEVLSIQETINYFKTKYAGEYPTEGRVVAGAATFTVDLIESPTLRGLLSNTSAVSGTKTIIGVNSGAKAKTGKLRLHPMYAGADKSEDITILRAAPAVTDERTYSADGKKLMKVVFTVMGVKTALETPAITEFAAHINSSGIKVKMANANDLGVSVASAAEDAVNDSTNIVNFTVGIGANRAIFFKSSDNFATAANTSYYEPTADEIKAGSFAPGTVTWKTLTALTEIPTEATGYYYKAIEIGV